MTVARCSSGVTGSRRSSVNTMHDATEPKTLSAARLEANRRNGAKGGRPRTGFDGTEFDRLVVEGKWPKEIAEALGISLRTLQRHRRRTKGF